MYMAVFAWLYCVCTICVPGIQGSQKETLDFPMTRVTDSCELYCGRWELNLGLLQEHLVPLITELSLRPLLVF